MFPKAKFPFTLRHKYSKYGFTTSSGKACSFAAVEKMGTAGPETSDVAAELVEVGERPKMAPVTQVWGSPSSMGTMSPFPQLRK